MCLVRVAAGGEAPGPGLLQPDVVLHGGEAGHLGPHLVPAPEQAGQVARAVVLGLERGLSLGLGQGRLGLQQGRLSLSLKSLLFSVRCLSLLLKQSGLSLLLPQGSLSLSLSLSLLLDKRSLSLSLCSLLGSNGAVHSLDNL